MTKRKRKNIIPKTHVSKKFVARKTRELLLVGQLLSNWAYNMKRGKPMTKEIRMRLDLWRKNWDYYKKELPKWMKGKK